MTRRASLALSVLAAALAVGCGGGDDDDGEGGASEIPGGADPAQAEVIREWSDTLRSGDVEGAAEFFEVPSIAQNGTPPVPLTSREDVVAFNEALPCGAELIRAEEKGRYTVATFELTERPGPGTCGSGTGETARTAFAIRDGLIVEWRRVPTPVEAAPPAEGPVV
jgi:hypothetical protein